MSVIDTAKPRGVLLSTILDRTMVLFIIFVAQITLTSLLVPGYFSIPGLFDVTRQFSESGIIALGMTMVIITGGIDLSVGALVALVSVTIGFTYQAGVPLGFAILLGMVVGTLGGFFNGLMITKLRLHPLVVTLGTFALFRGISFAWSDANAVSRFEPWFSVFGQLRVAGFIPIQLIVFAVLAIVVAIILSRTVFGRIVYAIGNNELGARFSGINTDRVKIAVYTATGFLTALSALILTSRSSTARGNAAYGMELVVIAMVVLGGTRITGGYGTIGGTIMGILILTYLQDGLAFAGVRSDTGLVLIGVCLIVGVFLNEFFRKQRA